MATRGLFNYGAADARGESPFNSDPGNLCSGFGFAAIRTSLTSEEDKLCWSTGDWIALRGRDQIFCKHSHLLGSLSPSVHRARLLREVMKARTASSGKQERLRK